MNFKEVINHENVDFSGIEASYFLLGLLSAFDNRFQTIADKLIQDISWKQFFAILCINLCKNPPTIKELSDIMGTSHQNIKQILLKLEKKGFVTITLDRQDKRKQRIILTEKCLEFCKKNENNSDIFVQTMFHDISQEQLSITIQTIIKMEDNLKKNREEET